MNPEYEYLLEPTKGSSFHSFILRKASFGQYWHRHAEVELCFISKGKGTRFIGDHSANYEEGDLVLIGGDLPHTWISHHDLSPESEAYVIQFDPKLFSNFQEFKSIQDLIKRSRHGLYFPSPSDSMIDTIKAVVHESGVSALMKLVALLFLLNSEKDALPLSQNIFTGLKGNKTARDRIEKTTEYIYTNYTKGISLESVAEEVHMTPPSFSRWFKSEMGLTYLDYVNRLRVHSACQLLINENSSVSGIGLRSGFENSSTFNRVFRQWTGSNPREYRKQQN